MDARVLQILSESFTKILIPGILVTIPLTLISFALALVIAVVVAMVQYANVPVLKQISRFYIWLIRGTPLLVQLMVGFYGLKAFGIETTAFVTAVVVFALNEGAYCSETIRGCLESVPKGQMEAGYCVGMSYMQIMWHVVLPQAFRTAFPSLGNSFMRTRQIIGRTYVYLPLYIEVAIVYLLFCSVISWLQKLGEKKLNSYGGTK